MKRTRLALLAAAAVLLCGALAFAAVEEARSSCGLGGALAAFGRFEHGAAEYELFGVRGVLTLPLPKDAEALRRLLLAIPAPARLAAAVVLSALPR